MFQIKVWKSQESFAYFKISKPISWGKRPAERRRRFIQRFPNLFFGKPGAEGVRRKCRNPPHCLASAPGAWVAESALGCWFLGFSYSVTPSAFISPAHAIEKMPRIFLYMAQSTLTFDEAANHTAQNTCLRSYQSANNDGQ